MTERISDERLEELTHFVQAMGEVGQSATPVDNAELTAVLAELARVRASKPGRTLAKVRSYLREQEAENLGSWHPETMVVSGCVIAILDGAV